MPCDSEGRGWNDTATSQLKTKDCQPTTRKKRQGRICYRIQREHVLANTLISSFCPPELWTKCFCYFKLPSLWYFVMASLGTTKYLVFPYHIFLKYSWPQTSVHHSIPKDLLHNSQDSLLPLTFWCPLRDLNNSIVSTIIDMLGPLKFIYTVWTSLKLHQPTYG